MNGKARFLVCYPTDYHGYYVIDTATMSVVGFCSTRAIAQAVATAASIEEQKKELEAAQPAKPDASVA